MQASNLVRDLAAISLLGSALGLVARLCRFPSVVGFLVAGFLIGPYSPFGTKLVPDVEQVRQFAELGMLLLLFSLGLEMGFRRLRSLGLLPVFIALIETFGVWFLAKEAAEALGRSPREALFIGACLAISSTTVIMTVLKQKGLKSARFAELLVGILLVEDLIAVLMFVYLPAAAGGSETFEMGRMVLLLVGSVFVWWLLGTIVAPRYVAIMHRFGGDELLLISSLGLGLGLAFAATSLHLSGALGAFVMGAILADTRLIRRIEDRIEPVRQVFGVLFFVSFGMLSNPKALEGQWHVVAGLACVLVFGKTFFPFLACLLGGRPFRDAVRVGGGLANIGEFSFAVAEIGVVAHVLAPDAFAMVVAIAVFTVFLTPLSIEISGIVATFLDEFLPVGVIRVQTSYATALGELSNSLRFGSGAGGVLSRFGRKLQARYRRLAEVTTTATLKRLAPWDEYLSEVLLVPGSMIEGCSLRELDLRRSYSVNLVAIERDFQTFVPPDPDVRFLPHDSILVYGSEEAISSFSQACLPPRFAAGGASTNTLLDCELRVLQLPYDCDFHGKTLIEARLREMYGVTLLAVVRDANRIKNPAPDFVLGVGDELYVVGTRDSVERLQERIGL